MEAIAAAACELWLALDRRADASRGEGAPVASPPIPEAPSVADRSHKAADDTKNSFAGIAQAILSPGEKHNRKSTGPLSGNGMEPVGPRSGQLENGAFAAATQPQLGPSRLQRFPEETKATAPD